MTEPSQPTHGFDYGRMLADFTPDDVYQHPFELTVDASIVGPYMASFIDVTPMWTSDRFARAAHLPGRPVPPHLLLNLGLSFSVHDVSQQAIAHLAYVSVKFPKPLPLGGTVRGASRVISAKAASSGDRGIVHVQTVLCDEHGDRVLDFERKALIRAGRLGARPELPVARFGTTQAAAWLGDTPQRYFADTLVEQGIGRDAFRPPLWGTWEDLEPGTRLLHAAGRTVGESEHMQLSAICRNTHPLHWDSMYCKDNSFMKERVVYGGLVLAWTLTQTSLDVGGHVLWESHWTDGAHPSPVLAGDTIYAATEVLSRKELNAHMGLVTLRVVGVKNRRPGDLLAEGRDLFAPERDKKGDERVLEKVVELTREVLVRRRG